MLTMKKSDMLSVHALNSCLVWLYDIWQVRGLYLKGMSRPTCICMSSVCEKARMYLSGLQLCTAADDEMIKVISKQIKMRNDAINEFKKADRQDLISQNEKEIEILNSYLPPKLSDEEVNKILDEAFSLVNPTSSKDMGKIMKEVSSKVAGRADMSVVSTLIRDRLNNL